jgi:hypothetical protein
MMTNKEMVRKEPADFESRPCFLVANRDVSLSIMYVRNRVLHRVAIIIALYACQLVCQER